MEGATSAWRPWEVTSAQDGGGLRLRLAQLPAWVMGTRGSLLQSTDEGDGLHGERETGTIC